MLCKFRQDAKQELLFRSFLWKISHSSRVNISRDKSSDRTREGIARKHYGF